MTVSESVAVRAIAVFLHRLNLRTDAEIVAVRAYLGRQDYFSGRVRSSDLLRAAGWDEAAQYAEVRAEAAL